MALIVDLGPFRIRIGSAVDDASRDAEIEAALEIVYGAIEDYLDRKLEFANQVERHTHTRCESVNVIRYPIAEVNSVVADGVDVWFHFDDTSGVINFDRYIFAHELILDYDGGYVELPPALMIPILATFDAVWALVSADTGGTLGTTKSVRAGDLSITYESGGSSSSYGALLASDPAGLIPPMAAAMLRLYRREKA